MYGEKDSAMAVAVGPCRPRTLFFGKCASRNTFRKKNLSFFDGFPLILVLAGVVQIAALRLGKCINFFFLNSYFTFFIVRKKMIFIFDENLLILQFLYKILCTSIILYEILYDIIIYYNCIYMLFYKLIFFDISRFRTIKMFNRFT